MLYAIAMGQIKSNQMVFDSKTSIGIWYASTG